MKFHVLGPLGVATSAGPVVIRARRLRAVLAILLLHPSAIVSMERIIDGVWPTSRPRSAVENIRTYIWQLRSLLQQAGDEGRLESQAGGYRLRTEPEELDLLRFNTLAADGRKALRGGKYPGAAVMLEEALKLWRGDTLPDLELGPAIRAKTDALNEQRRAIELDWIGARIALGEHADVVGTLRELTAERPLDESVWRYLVVTLASMGRTAEALAAYAEARENLVTELGIEPGPELQKLQVAILQGKDVADLAPRAVTTATLGRATLPRELPAGEPGFVGRQDAVASVRDLVEEIRSPGVERRAVVAVSGPPGVGKSATAIAAAAAVRDAFPDGQLYVDLRGSTERPLGASEALASVLDGFGLQPAALPESLDRRRSLYRSLLAERRMLILLDDAVTVGQVAPLIPGSGHSLLLVTSPRLLSGIKADVQICLAPLSNDEAVRMLAQIVGPDRVTREPQAASRIVDACGCLPLAIRIAGDRLWARPDFPLDRFADRLSPKASIMDELAVDGLGMRARLDASFEALDPATQKSFSALGLIRADAITPDQLGKLLHLPTQAADRELERLVHEGLLLPETTGPRELRYRMPSPLHAYANERAGATGALEFA